MRMLVVDDDFASRMFLRNAISSYGTCDTAGDGLEGVKAFQTAWEENRPYDLIFLDIMMPFLDGLGVLKLVREMEKQKKLTITKRSKIIMTSALQDKKTLDDVFDLGCDSFLAKPIDLQLLLNEIEKDG